MNDFSEILEKIKSGDLKIEELPDDFKSELTDYIAGLESEQKTIFTPSPGPQTAAYFSEADILLYGGFPAAGKTSLGLGYALNEGENCLMVRRAFTDVDGMFRDCKRLVESAGCGLDGFVGGNRPVYNKPGRRGYIAFEGLERTNGEIDYGKQGRPFDFIYVDEGAQLPQDAILLLIGWNRSVNPKKRCRMIIGSNPPLDSTGDWMCEFFAPWLDDRYENPAKPGELRWFIMDKDGKSVEAKDGNPVIIDGEEYYPHSRSYIPGRLEDNPFIGMDYKKKLQLLPPKIREVLMSGNFMVMRSDPPDQLIPTDWVRAAIERGNNCPYPPEKSVLCSVGYDLAQGGNDNAVIAKNFDGWFELAKKSGQDVPRGSDLGMFLFEEIGGERPFLGYDASGGYGSGLYEYLIKRYDMNLVKEFKGKETSAMRSKCKRYKFVSTRAAAYWKLREALDPDQEGGSPIMLPDDRRLFSGLTAVRYELTTRGYAITTKEDVKKMLGGKSPDEADAVAIAWWVYLLFGSAAPDRFSKREKKLVFANVGYEHRKRRR